MASGHGLIFLTNDFRFIMELNCSLVFDYFGLLTL